MWLALRQNLRGFSNACSLKPYKETKWCMPNGNPTGIYVYNCVAGEKVPLILNDPHIATWYSCGPTVYDSTHIGHASCYVKGDILQRILKNIFNIKLVTAMGITDIDDKIINKALDENTDFVTISKNYEQEFWLDMAKLGVEKPTIVTRVSEYIPTIQSFIQKLIDQNDAYIANDGSVYFDTGKYNTYGKLQKMQQSEEIKNPDKYRETDFALWKANKPNEPFWEASWGKGRPGWHIECSAMASKIFGSQLDFHAGGIDLQFPHHENEEAQSCAYHNKNQWINYWIHFGHLHAKGDVKMSKSLKNTVSISNLLSQQSGEAFRMACLLSNYRFSMEYSKDMMVTAQSVVDKFKYFFIGCEKYVNDTSRGDGHYEESIVEKLQKVEESVIESLQDDFNTSNTINTLLNLTTKINKVIRDTEGYYPVPVLLVSEYIKCLLSNYGLQLTSNSNKDNISNILIDTLVEFRHEVRKTASQKKDKELLMACDVVRDKMKSLKVQINDSKQTASWVSN